jgi:hypothetical protein
MTGLSENGVEAGDFSGTRLDPTAAAVLALEVALANCKLLPLQ